MNYYQQFLRSGKLALCFSDPAGANACLGLAKILTEEKQRPLLFSNKQYTGAVEHQFDIIVSETIPDWNKLGVEILFTSTSHPDSSNGFEIKCIKAAKQNGLYVISFIDHWVNYKLRFEGLDVNEYPNEIWVLDENAKVQAIEEGLPEEKLMIRKNPYHVYLKEHWTSNYIGKSYLSEFGIDINQKHILFAPDPISLRIGKERAGFTEEEVLVNLITTIKRLKVSSLLLVKLHPLQSIDVLMKVIKEHKGQAIILPQNVNIPELINAVNLVIGFFSNFLLDALAIGKNVVRFFPGNSEVDVLRHAKLDASFISTYAELEKAILKFDEYGS